MRVWAVLLAATFMLAPLTVQAADLVVWWEEGFNPEEDQAVEELTAAFEAKTGKDVELAYPSQSELGDQIQAAFDAGQPPDFVFGTQLSRNLDG